MTRKTDEMTEKREDKKKIDYTILSIYIGELRKRQKQNIRTAALKEALLGRGLFQTFRI